MSVCNCSFIETNRMFRQISRVNKACFSKFREEKDTFGPIQVPEDKYWGAQTQRSIQNFDIARETDKMPLPIVRAMGILKKCAAKVNVGYALSDNVCKSPFIQRRPLSKRVTK